MKVWRWEKSLIVRSFIHQFKIICVCWRWLVCSRLYFLLKVMGVKIFGSPWQPDFSQSAFCLQRGEQLKDKWVNIFLKIFFSWQSSFPVFFRWAKIPKDTQVLVTHGPPLGVGDLCSGWGGRAGDQKISCWLLWLRTNISIYIHQDTKRGTVIYGPPLRIGYQEQPYMIITRPQMAGCEDLLEQVAKVVKPKLHVFGHIHEGEVRDKLNSHEVSRGNCYEDTWHMWQLFLTRTA